MSKMNKFLFIFSLIISSSFKLEQAYAVTFTNLCIQNNDHCPRIYPHVFSQNIYLLLLSLLNVFNNNQVM